MENLIQGAILGAAVAQWLALMPYTQCFLFLCGRMFYSPLSEGFYLIMIWSTQLKIDGLKWVT